MVGVNAGTNFFTADCEGMKSEGDKVHTWGKEKGNISVSCSKSALEFQLCLEFQKTWKSLSK